MEDASDTRAGGPVDKPEQPAGGAALAKRRREARKKRQAGGKRRGNGNGKQGGKAAPVIVQVKPVAPAARVKKRHWGVLLSFVLLVLLPIAAAFWYLETRAADQYASITGFTVRRADAAPAAASDLLGGLAKLSSGSSSDTDILYEFIQSQKLVELVDQKLDLRKIWSKPRNDPVFAFDPRGSIEDLVDYWERMVNIYYDGSNGLIQVQVKAFDPEDARNIARAIVEESTRMINRLSAVARADTMRYAKEDLDLALARLKKARQAITAFRNKAQIVDPNADIQGQMGLLNTLQQQLASTLIELDLLRETARKADPRIVQLERKISVIQARIKDERKKFGFGGGGAGGTDYASLVSEYEGLTVELEFAQRTYLSALTAFDTAKAEAQRQTRYLAAFVAPTLAQKPQYPKRPVLLGILGFFLFLSWAILVLVSYSIKDRR